MHRSKEAIVLYHQALSIDPQKIGALNNLAWLLAADSEADARNGAEAVRPAEQAAQLTGYNDPTIMGTLGAAYAEAAQFLEAVAAGQKAETLAMAAGDKELVEKNHQMVELYKTRTPYHEPATAGKGNR